MNRKTVYEWITTLSPKQLAIFLYTLQCCPPPGGGLGNCGLCPLYGCEDCFDQTSILTYLNSTMSDEFFKDYTPDERNFGGQQ